MTSYKTRSYQNLKLHALHITPIITKCIVTLKYLFYAPGVVIVGSTDVVVASTVVVVAGNVLVCCAVDVSSTVVVITILFNTQFDISVDMKLSSSRVKSYIISEIRHVL